MAGRYKVTGQFFSSSDFKSFVFVPQTGHPARDEKLINSMKRTDANVHPSVSLCPCGHFM